MTGIDVFIGHQSAHIENHLHSQSVLYPKRNCCRNMTPSMDDFDSVTAREFLCMTDASNDIINSCW